jgi:tRNA pseudouridine13 synthase
VALSARGRENPISLPTPGDMLIFSDGRMDRVTPSLLPAARMQVERGRAIPALFIPGSREEDWKQTSPRVIGILEERGITASHFRSAQEVVGTSFQGFSRPIGLTTGLSFRIEQNDVYLHFTLAPGQYATTVCRELMKSDPLSLI